MNFLQRFISFVYVKWVVIPRLEKAMGEHSTLRVRLTHEYVDDENIAKAMREKEFNELH